jgi:dATP pyrophosphohydrolase
MPDIVSDIVDVYVFRRQNARVQFLLLQRKATVPLGNTWQSFHTQIQAHETTVMAARRAVRELAGLPVSEAYSADYINEFFDDARDVVVLAPVLAVVLAAQAPVTLGRELKEASWWDVNQAVARLPFSGQRWAIKHINDLMSAGYNESQLYRLQLPDDIAPPVRPMANDSGEVLTDSVEGDGERPVDSDANVEPVLRDFFHDVDADDAVEDDERSSTGTARYRTDVP